MGYKPAHCMQEFDERRDTREDTKAEEATTQPKSEDKDKTGSRPRNAMEETIRDFPRVG